MANITVHEFFSDADNQGELLWPADVTTTVADSATHTLRGDTRCFFLTTDTSCRASILTGASAVASGMNVLSSVPNFFKCKPGPARQLKFV